MRKLILFSIVFVFTFGLVLAQANKELYEKGLLCRKNRDYLCGYNVFGQLLKNDSNQVNYLVQGSFFYTKHGSFLPGDDQKMAHYVIATRLALRAIVKESRNADAHYVYAMALGYISSLSGIKVKIDNSKLIKSEIEIAVKLDNTHAGAYHLLGLWHKVVSGFSSVEKSIINTFFGGIAREASFENAIRCFARAIILEPAYKMHMVAMAETYYEMGLNEYAKYWIEKAAAMATRNEDDKAAQLKCGELLKKLK